MNGSAVRPADRTRRLSADLPLTKVDPLSPPLASDANELMSSPPSDTLPL